MSSSTPSQDDWIRVTSRDSFSFIAKRSVVFRSGTLRNMLDERRTSTLLLISRVVHPDVTTPTRRQLRRGYTKSLSRRRKVPPSIPPSFRLRFSSLNVSLRAAVTEKFVEFLAYKTTYENAQSTEEIPDFSERIAPEIALELCVCDDSRS